YAARIDGDEGTLVVSAKVAGSAAAGTIGLVRENGAWRVSSVLYDIGRSRTAATLSEAAPPGGQTKAQREAWRGLQEKGFPRPDQDLMVMVAREGDVDAVRLFLEAGYPVDGRSHTETALIAAARAGKAAVVLLLIDKGADVNAADQIQMTPLLGAADQCAMTDVIRVLLAHGARLDARTAGGASALELAKYAGCDANVALLSKD